MRTEELIRYWVTTANDDWESVQKAFASDDYVKALFWGHLYLEKLLKALIVHRTQKHAPYGHTLPVLARKAGSSPTPSQIRLLRRATDYNIQARYPDHKFQLEKRATREFCQQELKEIEEFGTWLKSILAS